jgi:crotonobetainyl-CoA:carnitine CoA-transferase CaiB-like acyl-CoA transferase
MRGLFGYGEDGPYAGRAAYDDLLQGAVGLPGLYTQAGGDRPRYVPLAMADRVVGLFGANAILAALWSKARTGRGQNVEVPMFETMAHFVLGDHLAGELYDPPIGPAGYSRLLSKDRRPYATRDGHVCAVIYNDGHWRRFFRALGMERVLEQDQRFASITSRTQHIDEIYATVANILGERTTAECVELLDAADIPVTPLQTVDELLRDPHLLAKGFFMPVEHPSEGRLRMPQNPARFSRTPPRVDRPAPLLGEHSRAILEELCFDAHRVDWLFAEGVIDAPAESLAPAAIPRI